MRTRPFELNDWSALVVSFPCCHSQELGKLGEVRVAAFPFPMGEGLLPPSILEMSGESGQNPSYYLIRVCLRRQAYSLQGYVAIRHIVSEILQSYRVILFNLGAVSQFVCASLGDYVVIPKSVFKKA